MPMVRLFGRDGGRQENVILVVEINSEGLHDSGDVGEISGEVTPTRRVRLAVILELP